jgi:glutaredoxin
MEHVDGTVDRGEVVLYALSTCVWCKKTRKLLEEELGVTYDYEYVDLATPDRRDEIEAGILARVGRTAYPTICTPDECVTGYRPDDIRRLLDL